MKRRSDVLYRDTFHGNVHSFSAHKPIYQYLPVKETSITVIRKGKGYCPTEQRSKVNLSVDNNGFVVSHEVYCQNHHDRQLLKPAIKNFERKTGTSIKQINTDQGYNQKEKNSGFWKKIDKVCIPWNGKKKNPAAKTTWFLSAP